MYIYIYITAIDIHSFIHIEHLYIAPSRKTTQRRSQLQCG